MLKNTKNKYELISFSLYHFIIMTYFPESILSNILTFCDDRIERRQKYYHKILITDIKYAFDNEEPVEEKSISTRLCNRSYIDFAPDLYTMWICRDFEETMNSSWFSFYGELTFY